MDTRYSYHKTEGVPLKLWDSHGAFEDAAMKQLTDTAKLPFIHHHVAGMPDVHLGLGATIGSVVPTIGAIIPAAVGVDIGCGMMAVKTSINADWLPDSLSNLRSHMESVVPHGRTDNGWSNDKGSHSEINKRVSESWLGLRSGYENIIAKHPEVSRAKTVEHLGTLGTGNHFIELCLDEEDTVWVMLHSGSRGVGNRIGSYFISKAKEEMERYHISKFLPDKDLAYLVEKTDLFTDYVEAVGWAQSFARVNRNVMMNECLDVLKKHFPDLETSEKAINCHHNYISRENHYKQNVWVTRKGAVRARKGDLGIIPGSMGTGSFIVEGLGNKDSFCSCSHGAGRVMSRGQAKREISMEQHANAMTGIEARLDKDVLDESPAAYKDIGAVMQAQDDLVKIKYRLRQVLNIKG